MLLDSFTVISYNILTDKCATPQLFGYVPSWFINWEYRKQLVVHEILSYDPDIVCLQVYRQCLLPRPPYRVLHSFPGGGIKPIRPIFQATVQDEGQL